MTEYTPTLQTNYDYPYKLMLHDIQEQIDTYKSYRQTDPVYIIVNPDDIQKLRYEMATLKLIPLGDSGKLEFKGIKIIQSPDISKGFFEVMGR